MFFSVFATSLTLKTYDFYGFSYVSSLEPVCSARACSASVRSLKSTGASGADRQHRFVGLVARFCKTRVETRLAQRNCLPRFACTQGCAHQRRAHEGVALWTQICLLVGARSASAADRPHHLAMPCHTYSALLLLRDALGGSWGFSAFLRQVSP